MKIKKIIETGINVTDYIRVYSDVNNLLDILRDKFVGRCFRECYITEIIRIIKASECMISTEPNPTHGTIHVILEVYAIQYYIGEIINGTQITKREKNILMCKTDMCSISLNSHKSLDSLQIGQLISVRVGRAAYNIGSKRVSINAIPLLHSNKPRIYRYDSKETLDIQLFSYVLKNIKEEEDKLASLDKQKYNLFSKMLYTYKTDKSKSNTIDVLDIISGKVRLKDGAMISRDSELPLETSKVYLLEPNTTVDDNLMIAPFQTGLLLILQDSLNYMRTIREMIDIYADPEIYDKHNNLWLIFNKFKLQ